MCGITGFKSSKFNKENLIKMTDKLTHRGPDAYGFFFNRVKNIGLGHRRLSILDLSNNANQPMNSHCGRYVMVFNGEIYNYKEIRSLIKNKYWKTNSDSEVILEAFVKWGLNFVEKLNGMFAIAIYDKIEDKLHLFRDRMGIKPLYYYHKEDQFIFASEIKSIKSLNIDLSIDQVSIVSYLHLGYIPKPNSIYNEIKKIKSGTYLTFEKGMVKEHNYWDSNRQLKEKTIINFKEAKIKLTSLIHDSIEKRLISDVPLGTFLSGGTDSSLITALAQKINSKPINTFSIGFKELKYNESEEAKKISNYLNTNHHEFILSEKDALAEIEEIIDHMDEPFADSSILPTMLVSKMAKKYVSVCLTGDGGDELFMGYGSYTWANRINNPFFKHIKKPISKILLKSKSNRNKRGGTLIDTPNKNWKSHIFSQSQNLFTEKEIKNIFKFNISLKIIDKVNSQEKYPRKLYSDEEQAFFDLNNYLIDDLLVKVDRASMYSSLEARVPLLDHRIVEYSLNLDKSLKNKGKTQKFLLKEVLYEFIPRKIMKRPKWGFSIPLEKWLQNELYYLIEKYLNKQSFDELKLFNYKEIDKLKYRFINGEFYLYNRLWSLIILVKFLKNE